MASRFGLAAIVLLLSIAHAAAGKAAWACAGSVPLLNGSPRPRTQRRAA